MKIAGCMLAIQMLFIGNYWGLCLYNKFISLELNDRFGCVCLGITFIIGTIGTAFFRQLKIETREKYLRFIKWIHRVLGIIMLIGYIIVALKSVTPDCVSVGIKPLLDEIILKILSKDWITYVKYKNLPDIFTASICVVAMTQWSVKNFKVNKTNNANTYCALALSLGTIYVVLMLMVIMFCVNDAIDIVAHVAFCLSVLVTFWQWGEDEKSQREEKNMNISLVLI